MGMNIREDVRSLRDFYPDAAQRYQVHYAFAHRFLPQYIHHNPRGFFSCLYDHAAVGEAIDPTRFLHARWSAIFEPLAGLTPRQVPTNGELVARRVSDLSMTLEQPRGFAAALIRMPTPEKAVGAFAVCAVLLAPASDVGSWPADVKARVFTLEADCELFPRERIGVLCEWTAAGQHRNFGTRVPADGSAFLEAVGTCLSEPALPCVADFTPSMGGAPAKMNLRTDAPGVGSDSCSGPAGC